MTRLGLLLGGGGAVGIAWENGVLAGLVDAIEFEPSAATVIIGTSAGAAVGADMALGKDPHDALALDEDSSNARRDVAPPDLTQGSFAEIIGLMMSPDARTPELVARIGALAIEAETRFSEDDFVALFERSVGTNEWPAVDFRPTAASCTTGRRQVWTAADGIGLARAVASSCAIPGFFPTVSFGGDRYMDGSRGRGYHTAMVEDLGLDAALYIGPRIAAVEGVNQLLVDDMDALAATGVRVHTMLGSETLDAAALNLMDFSLRPKAFEIGLADGAANAATVADLLA